MCTPDCRIKCYSYCDDGCCIVSLVARVTGGAGGQLPFVSHHNEPKHMPYSIAPISPHSQPLDEANLCHGAGCYGQNGRAISPLPAPRQRGNGNPSMMSRRRQSMAGAGARQMQGFSSQPQMGLSDLYGDAIDPRRRMEQQQQDSVFGMGRSNIRSGMTPSDITPANINPEYDSPRMLGQDMNTRSSLMQSNPQLSLMDENAAAVQPRTDAAALQPRTDAMMSPCMDLTDPNCFGDLGARDSRMNIARSSQNLGGLADASNPCPSICGQHCLRSCPQICCERRTVRSSMYYYK